MPPLSLSNMPEGRFINRTFREQQLLLLQLMRTTGPFNGSYRYYYINSRIALWTDELREKRLFDLAKLQLINMLPAPLLKKVVGVQDRTTRAIKFRDPTVIQTLDNKLRLKTEIVEKDPVWRRKLFESRTIKALDDLTVLCNDVNRIIAKFAIMD